VNSVGSKGHSLDNARAETIIGLDKTDLIRRSGLWKGIDDDRYSTLEWVDWFNHRRLLGTWRRHTASSTGQIPIGPAGSRPIRRPRGERQPYGGGGGGAFADPVSAARRSRNSSREMSPRA
jgi:transposase InsO family protein